MAERSESGAAEKSGSGSEKVCKLCGLPKKRHTLVNFADGTFVGNTVLICPTGVYHEQ